jgi:two-component system, CitB family, response regulator MalR
MIKALIVEDDPMVAEFNKRYLSEVEGYQLTGIAHTVMEAIEFIKNKTVNLILLDVYMPGSNGIELMKYVREQNLEIDIILITAASEVERIQTALRYGAVDYLIKPFEFERFNQALVQYRDKYNFLKNNQNIRQEELDEKILTAEQKKSIDSSDALPKGLTRSTLHVIINVIKEKGSTPFSTDEIAESTYISRVSVRKYLKFLLDLGVLDESMTYGIGRPVYYYTYREDKLNQASIYL